MPEHFKFDSFISASFTKSYQKKIPFLVDIKAFKILRFEEGSVGVVWKCKAGKFPSYGTFTINPGNPVCLEEHIRDSRKYFMDICDGSAVADFPNLSAIVKSHWFYNNTDAISYDGFRALNTKGMISNFLKTDNKKRNIVDFLSKLNL